MFVLLCVVGLFALLVWITWLLYSVLYELAACRESLAWIAKYYRNKDMRQFLDSIEE